MLNNCNCPFIDALFDGVALVEGGKIVRINTGGRRLLGLQVGEQVSLNDFAPSPEKIAEGGRQMLWRFRRDVAVNLVQKKLFPADVAWRATSNDGKTSEKASPGNGILVFRDASEVCNLETQLHGLALKDDLTGLLNQAGLVEVAQHFFSARKNAGLLALIVVDVSTTASYRSRPTVFGGIIIETALRIKNAVRGEDIVARTGPMEFTVIATSVADIERVDIVARRIAAALTPLCEVGGVIEHFPARVGIAILARDGMATHDLLEAARCALEVHPSDDVIFADPELHASRRAIHEQTKRLNRAITGSHLNVMASIYTGNDDNVTLLRLDHEGVDEMTLWQRALLLNADQDMLRSLLHAASEYCGPVICTIPNRHLQLAANIAIVLDFDNPGFSDRLHFIVPDADKPIPWRRRAAQLTRESMSFSAMLDVGIGLVLVEQPVFCNSAAGELAQYEIQAAKKFMKFYFKERCDE